jgi:tetraacyldisaccharide 4'-kinase
MQIELIQSGKRTDPIAMAIRTGLWIVSMPYGMIVWFRGRRFDQGKTIVHRADVPVVCVGNLTAGGTGKTPVVCYLGKWLRGQDVRVAIISRGYRSDGSGVNDEAKELSQRLPDVPQVQDADRFAAAKIAVEELECEFLLMDDGFQHRRLHRDLDVVVVDATNPFGFGYLLPRGLLREPIRGLQRAGVVLISRCDLVNEGALQKIETTLRRHAKPGTPMLRCEHSASELIQVGNEAKPIDWLRAKSVITVCAIGNPAAFEATIDKLGAKRVESLRFPDHDGFGRDAIERLRACVQANAGNVDAVLCTHKDLVKIETDVIASRPLLAVGIDLTILGEPSGLLDQLKPLIRRDEASAQVIKN